MENELKDHIVKIKDVLNTIDGQIILDFLIEEFILKGEHANCTSEQLHYRAGQRDLVIVLRNIANTKLNVKED